VLVAVIVGSISNGVHPIVFEGGQVDFNKTRYPLASGRKAS